MDLADSNPSIIQIELQKSLDKLQNAFESLFLKYGKEFEEDEIIDVFTGEIIQGENIVTGQIEELSDSDSVKSDFVDRDSDLEQSFPSEQDSSVYSNSSDDGSSDNELVVSDFEQRDPASAIEAPAVSMKHSEYYYLNTNGTKVCKNDFPSELVSRKLFLVENNISKTAIQQVCEGGSVVEALQAMYKKIGAQLSMLYASVDGNNSSALYKAPQHQYQHQASLQAQAQFQLHNSEALTIQRYGVKYEQTWNANKQSSQRYTDCTSKSQNILGKWIQEVCPENRSYLKRKYGALLHQDDFSHNGSDSCSAILSNISGYPPYTHNSGFLEYKKQRRRDFGEAHLKYDSVTQSGASTITGKSQLGSVNGAGLSLSNTLWPGINLGLHCYPNPNQNLSPNQKGYATVKYHNKSTDNRVIPTTTSQFNIFQKFDVQSEIKKT